MLTGEVKQSIEESVLCWLATADEHGMPNCSPKEVFCHYGDEQIIIANIASPQSVNNIKVNPNVCLSFVHVLKQKGFKVKASARYIEPHEQEYPPLFKAIEPMVGTVFPVKGIILLTVKQIQPVIAPSYYMVEGTTESQQIENAKKAYAL